MATTAGAETVCGQFQATARRHAEAVALRAANGCDWTWQDYDRGVRETAAGLAGLGLRRGDVMASWLSNRPEFHLADAAAMHLGITSFSIYNTFTVEQARHVVVDAGARVLITEPGHVTSALAVRDDPATPLEHVILTDGDTPQALGWDELLDAAPPGFDFDAAWQHVESSDLATLIYTSGTTGPPKGVELSHENILRQTSAMVERMAFPERLRAVSFLPMAHIAERLCTHYFPMFLGWDVTCCRDPRAILEALLAVRPGYFFSPPRLWEKLRSAILAGLDEEERARLDRAIERVQAGAGRRNGPLQRRLRAQVGLDELQVAIVGAAPCPPEVIEFWHACGVPLSELYGMSETTGVATVAGPDEVRIGTVGPPISACEVRTSDTGEILMRGPVVMRGYRNLPERTAETIDADGWLRSGDIGEIDDDGHLRVVDRLKEIIINSAGKNMSPANIEATLKAGSALVAHACVVGDGRPYNVALLTLEPETTRAFAEARTLGAHSLAQLANHRVIREAVRKDVEMANERLARVEQVKRFVLLGTEWLPDGDELTPTMKLKRRPIAEKYAPLVDAVYAGSRGVEI
jgi:long-chain acyl-CoA synthetase